MQRKLLRSGCGVLRIALMMPDVGSANPEDDILSNIRRMVGNAFQIARDHQRIQRLCSQRGLLFDEE